MEILFINRREPEAVPCLIGEYSLPSVRDEGQKCLGKLLFFNCKSEDTNKLIKGILTEGIDNINKAVIGNEYKLWIYKNYFLPSKRFILTVHTLTKTHLKKLDTITDKLSV